MARNTTFTFYSDVNLNMRTNDTFYFENRNAQNSFFASHIVTTEPNCYYQRANSGKVKVKKHYSVLYKCDYLSFINSDYENKRFYAFITAVNYIDDDTTEVVYVIDHLQTWLLDTTFRPCFIERQHAYQDHFGDNILTDNLDLGEHVNYSITDGIPTRTLVIVTATFDVMAWLTQSGNPKNPTSTYVKQGIYDNLSQVAFVSETGGTNAGTGSALQTFYNNVFNGVSGVTMDDIVNTYIYPYIGVLLDEPGVIVPGTSSATDLFNRVFVVGGAKSETVNLPDNPLFQTNKKLDGYTPKNKKLYTYPYTCLHVSNNDGSSIDLKYEKFKDASGNIIEHPTAKVCGTSCAEAKLRLTPLYYMGNTVSSDLDFDYSIDSGSFPTCSMVGDAYQIYLAQNKNRISNMYEQMEIAPYKQLFTGLGNVGLGAMNGALKSGGSGAVMGALSGAEGMLTGAMQLGFSTIDKVGELTAQREDMKIAPSTASGISGVGLAYQNGKKNFTLTVKTLDYTHAKLVDDFFTLYGYPVRRIDHPRLKARTSFTYIKTVGCIVIGNIPEVSKGAIESAFDSGIRLWCNTSDIGNFNVVNDPISS